MVIYCAYSRYMRLKFKRSKCGNAHIVICAQTKKLCIYSPPPPLLENTRLNFKRISHSLSLSAVYELCVYIVMSVPHALFVV